MISLQYTWLTVYAYGLCLALGALAALALADALGRGRLPGGTVRVYAVIAIPLGVLCSRALYCAVNYNLFMNVWERPALMLAFYDGGLSMSGLLIGLALAAKLTSKLMKADLAALADALCAPTALFIAVERAAEGFTELGAGKVVEPGALGESVPWLFLTQRAGKIVEYRMAVYRYEAAAALLLFALLLALFLLARARLRPGDLSLLFLALYGSTQVLMESMRDDGHMLIIFLRVGQLLAAAMPVIATGALTRRYARARGKTNARAVLGWAVTALCIGALVFLEFSLDGRVTVGDASMGRDYLAMFAACAGLAAVPCSLLATLTKPPRRADRPA